MRVQVQAGAGAAADVPADAGADVAADAGGCIHQIQNVNA